MPAQTLIQIRRGTAASWTSANPTLFAGEWGYETDTGRYKVGDGLTSWTTLPYSAITPNATNLVTNSGIGASFGANGLPVTISVTGITSSQVIDFGSAVSGIVTSISISTEEIMDILGTGLVGASGIGIDYQDSSDQIVVNVTGITSSQVTNFNSSVSGLLPITDLTAGTGIGITNIGTDYTISVTGITTSLINDFASGVGNIVDTTLVAGTGIDLAYNSGTNELTIATTGVSFNGHTHVWSNITDASTKATLSERAYLSGVTAGTATASRALVVDANKDIGGIGSITTTGNITIGGNLNVQGTTTTVNSTTVDIGDNIIRVNTSGLTTGGFEVYTGVDYKQLVWNVSNNRWEFTGGNVYTTGNFIGNLTGNADTVTSGVYTYQTGTVTSTMILDGTIVNADINSSANINVQKLASGSTGQVLQVSSTGIIWGSIDGGTP
jgi:hypothetical protein